MTKEIIGDYTLRISQANRTELIVVLFDMALQYIDDAKNSFKSDDHDNFRKNCGYAEKVISDLMGALDYSYELAEALRRCYTFIQSRISLSVILNSDEQLLTAERMIRKLRGSFETIAKEDDSKPVMGNSESVYAGLTYGRRAVMDSLTTEAGRGFKV